MANRVRATFDPELAISMLVGMLLSLPALQGILSPIMKLNLQCLRPGISPQVNSCFCVLE